MKMTKNELIDQLWDENFELFKALEFIQRGIEQGRSDDSLTEGHLLGFQRIAEKAMKKLNCSSIQKFKCLYAYFVLEMEGELNSLSLKYPDLKIESPMIMNDQGHYILLVSYTTIK